VWLVAKRLANANITMGPIDREARREYDSRIEQQLPNAG
jgi:hypothetical protein